MEIKNKRLDDKLFYEIQRDVLTHYKTGQDVDFEDAINNFKNQNDAQNFAKVIRAGQEQGKVLIQPRSGVAALDKQIELVNYLHEHGHADCLSATIDSYTRHNRYDEVEKALDLSLKEGRSLLNGFPAVNHGVAGCRQLTSGIKGPIQVRHGTPDARLLAEITLAGGFTSFEGGGISYNIPYSKNIPLERTIFDWQYCDRLVGMYEEAGISINREPFGPLTGTLVPPSISHSVAIIEALLAAEQGVKDITVGYGQSGHLIQDVAAIRSLEALVKYYLNKFNYKNIHLSTVFHQWMGGFPAHYAQAYGVIAYGSATAALAGATKVIVKTPHEALGIPTKEANVEGLLTTRQVVDMLADQKMKLNQPLEAEMNIISLETKAIINKLLELGQNDIAQGAIIGFKSGVIDIPFAPSQLNKGLVLPARDNDGAIRILEMGDLPFDDDLKAFHQNKLRERALFEKRDVDFQMVVDDINAIADGKLIGRKHGEIYED